MKNIKLGKMKPKRQFSPMKATMLLLLLGFAAGNAMAQFRVEPKHRDQPQDNGLYINKSFEPDKDSEVTAGVLTLESYVTGEVKKITTSVPTDIVLLLDKSSSMRNKMAGSYGYNTVNNANYGYTYNNYGTNQYFYKDGDNYYQVYRESESIYAEQQPANYSYNSIDGAATNYYYYDGDGYYQVHAQSFTISLSRRRYCLYYDKGDTRYYLSNNAEGGVTTTRPTDVRDNSTTIWTGVLYLSTTYYRLYYNKSAVKYYLSNSAEGGVTTTAPTNVTGNTTTIWNGQLYQWSQGSSTMTRIEGLKIAVKQFIDIIAQDAIDHPSIGGHGESIPVDHKISIVVFDADTVALCGLTRVVEANGTSNAATLKSYVDAIELGSGTRTDLALTQAGEILPTPTLPLDEYLRKNVVVLFTDGEPYINGSTGTTVYNTCINAAKPLKQTHASEEDTYKSASVYTVGTFGTNVSETADVVKMMSYISSNYPNATAMNNIGTQAANTYSFKAESVDALSSVFEQIASESGGSTVDLGTQTVIQDVISDYFQLPEDADVNDIKVYTADCIGVDLDKINQDGFDSKGRKFKGQDDWTPVEIVEEGQEGYHLRLSGDNTTVQIDGFNFKENWCGLEIDEEAHVEYIHGKKLILQIPIVVKEDAWGDGLPTNGPMSVISEDQDIIEEHIIGHFISPSQTVQRNTWVEYVTSIPEDWSADNIDSPEDLAWLISVVNGYNGCVAKPDTDATITADIDMSDHNWVPIGSAEGYYRYDGYGNPIEYVPSASNNDGYTGIFDGGGHSITGLKNQPSKVFSAGLFGKVNGGTVRNTFVMDCDFNTGCQGHFGIIADTLCNGGVIYNCEAAGQLKSCNQLTNFLSPTFNPDDEDSYYREVDPMNIFLGGLVGLVDASEVHSAISVAEIYGFNMGGLVYETRGVNAAMENGYSYPTFFHWNPTDGGNVGGLVGLNDGKLLNCYIRERASDAEYSGGILFALDRIDILAPSSKAPIHKGLLVGQNNGSASYCYMTDEWWDGERLSQPYVGTGNAVASYGKFSATETPYMYKHNDNQVTMLGAKEGEPATEGLLAKLNGWVSTPTRGSYTYTTWFRTTADGINNDYPVLKIMDFNSVGSDDLVRLYYGNINDMMGNTSMYTSDIADDTYCIYRNAAVTTGNNDATLYINEDVAILQEESLDAYVGITLDNSAGASGANSNHPYYSGTDVIDWHMFSTSLSNAPLGINYTDTEVHNFSYDATTNPDYYFFPEVSTGATGEVVKDGYFPSHTYGKTSRDADYNYNADWDFYTFEEKYHHWMNFKRNSVSHWDEDPATGHANLQYDNANESELVPGKGYLLAIANETFLQSHGTLNNGGITYQTSYTSNPFTMGYNLIGNPYQSYLDFSEFGRVNGIDSYVILDEDAPGYVTGAAGSSKNTYPEGKAAPGNMIYMHQGFFIHVNSGTTITFNNDMRSIDNSSEPTFRGAHHNYPLVNLVIKEENGNREYLTVETNRPSFGGAKKMKGLRAGSSQMYAHADDDYAILFATEDMEEVPVRFSTEADATYTMIWNTQNGEFTKLQLIDNITGVTVDMLASDEYTFTSKTTDFESRFRLVFHAIDNDEDDDEAETEDGDFAFFDGSNLVVSGAGMLSVCDINGRVLYCTDVNGTQSSVSMPDMARGLYLLRLTNSASTKVQKIVIRK